MSGFSNNSNVPLKTFLGSSNQSTIAVDVFDRRIVSGTENPGTGNIYFTFFTAVENITVSNITMVSGTNPASGVTLCRLGLYSFDETTVTRLAQTAVDNSLFSAGLTTYTKAFDNSVATSVNLIQGNRYGVAIITVGTLSSQLLGAPQSDNHINSLSPKLVMTLPGQTDLVASSNSLINTTTAIWSRLT